MFLGCVAFFWDYDSKKQQYVDGEEYGGPHYFAAFLAYFLSFFVFPSPPVDGLSPQVFPLVAQMTSGKTFPFAAMFLGSLYQRLDQAHTDHARSVGRYNFVSFAHSQFLTAFLFERFPRAAPTPLTFQRYAVRNMRDALGRNLRDASGRVRTEEVLIQNYLIERWHNKSSKVPLNSIIDDVEGFIARPYTHLHTGIRGMELYSPEVRTIQFPVKEILHPSYYDMFCIVLPGALPVFTEHSDALAIYRPNRVRIQFGIDQGSPRAPAINFMALPYCERFTLEGEQMWDDDYSVIEIPSRGHVGRWTEGWYEYWHGCFVEFMDFVNSPSAIPQISPFFVSVA